ncbi:MAG: PilZ domain-containing protein [Woeseiaceae bacterium]
MSNEQRHFTRIPFNAAVTIIDSRTAKKYTTELIDISFKGILITKPENWDGNNGGHFTAHCQLSNKDIEISLAVIEVHKTEDVVGFKTTHMDLDSATHLRRLVELNLGSESLLERELHELIQA